MPRSLYSQGEVYEGEKITEAKALSYLETALQESDSDADSDDDDVEAVQQSTLTKERLATPTRQTYHVTKKTDVSLQQLIDLCKPGDTVVLHKGKYKNLALTLSKSITLTSATSSVKVALRGNGSQPVITCSAEKPTIQGLSIVYNGKYEGAISVKSTSTPHIVACNLKSKGNYVVQLEGRDNKSYLARNLVDKSRCPGLTVTGGARPTVEHNIFSHCYGTTVSVSAESCPEMKGNKFLENRGTSIQVTDASGWYEDNLFFHCNIAMDISHVPLLHTVTSAASSDSNFHETADSSSPNKEVADLTNSDNAATTIAYHPPPALHLDPTEQQNVPTVECTPTTPSSAPPPTDFDSVFSTPMKLPKRDERSPHHYYSGTPPSRSPTAETMAETGQGISVFNNLFKQCDLAVRLGCDSRGTVVGNEFLGNAVGVMCADRSCATVSKNKFTEGKKTGVILDSGSDCIVDSNKIGPMYKEGVRLCASAGGRVTRNEIKRCKLGVKIDPLAATEFMHNTVWENGTNVAGPAKMEVNNVSL
eukprot:TRINITY_DN67757_c3_g10_i1.p1 TRINITY_DN67757_c3_g10~~TRINITY_DN67757_c3_g10_i1.p1  ORF type:complete len:548 (-),score=55.47 TRINITY_DN67757_c3_g10_i1:66-1664(-)